MPVNWKRCVKMFHDGVRGVYHEMSPGRESSATSRDSKTSNPTAARKTRSFMLGRSCNANSPPTVRGELDRPDTASSISVVRAMSGRPSPSSICFLILRCKLLDASYFGVKHHSYLAFQQVEQFQFRAIHRVMTTLPSNSIVVNVHGQHGSWLQHTINFGIYTFARWCMARRLNGVSAIETVVRQTSRLANTIPRKQARLCLP